MRILALLFPQGVRTSQGLWERRSHLNKQEKGQVIADLKDKFSKAKTVVFTITRYDGRRDNGSEKDAEQLGHDYSVVKTPLRKSRLRKPASLWLADVFKGPVGIASAMTILCLPSRGSRLVKTNEKLRVKGAVVDGQLYGAADLKAIAALPSEKYCFPCWPEHCRLRWQNWPERCLLPLPVRLCHGITEIEKKHITFIKEVCIMSITKEQVFEFIDTMTILDMSQIHQDSKRGTALLQQHPWQWRQRPAQARQQLLQLKRRPALMLSLPSAGDKKIQVIKVVRELTGLGLKEARTLLTGPEAGQDGITKKRPTHEGET